MDILPGKAYVVRTAMVAHFRDTGGPTSFRAGERVRVFRVDDSYSMVGMESLDGTIESFKTKSSFLAMVNELSPLEQLADI